MSSIPQDNWMNTDNRGGGGGGLSLSGTPPGVNNGSTGVTGGVLREERVILNVGGIKYETYRTTLTAYPTTLLGTMFSDRNRVLLQPLPNTTNEFFFDRDGHIFRYIMQFYRTGRIAWKEPEYYYHHFYQPHHQHHHQSYPNHFGHNRQPDFVGDHNKLMRVAYYNHNGNLHPVITRQELATELDYFQIPADEAQIGLSFIRSATVASVDAFVAALKEMIYHLGGNFKTNIHITFYKNSYPGLCTVDREIHETAFLLGKIKDIIAPFGAAGFTILEKFGEEIGRHLKSEIPELSWSLEHLSASDWFTVHISINDPHDMVETVKEILKYSCLASTRDLK